MFRPKGSRSKKLRGFTVNKAKFFRIEPGFVTQCGMQPLDNNAPQKENCLNLKIHTSKKIFMKIFTHFHCILLSFKAHLSTKMTILSSFK